MRYAASLIAGLVLVLGAAAPAQSVAVMPYGQPGLYQPPIDPALFLDATEVGPNALELRMVGGFTGDPIALLIGGMPAQWPLGNGATVYVEPPVIPVFGVVDAWGEWAMQVPINDPALSGVTLYFQAVEALSVGGLSLSNGLSAAFPL